MGGSGFFGVPRAQEPEGTLPEGTVVERVHGCLACCRVQPWPVEYPPGEFQTADDPQRSRPGVRVFVIGPYAHLRGVPRGP